MISRIGQAFAWGVVLGVLTLLTPGTADAHGIVVDGGFESGAILEKGQAVTRGIWAANMLSGEGTIASVSSPIFSGSLAVQIDTRASTSGRFIYQDLEDLTGCFTWTFHVFPTQGRHVAEMIYSWRGDNGPLRPMSVLDYDETGITFAAWDASMKIPIALSPERWHAVTVDADADKKLQRLFVDGSQVGEVTATDVGVVADTIVIGDVGADAFRALYTYDHISLEERACVRAPTPRTPTPRMPTQRTSSPSPTSNASTPEPPASTATSDGGFPWWIIIVIVIVAGLVCIFFWRRRRSRPPDS
jgi:hypothetical protein